MMDSSSDEDELASKKTVRDGSGTARPQEGNGGVSPRTLQAIQKALMEDNNVSEELGKEVQTKQKKYVIVSSSDDDDADKAESRGMERIIWDEAQGGGGVSPQTLLAIQRALGEKESLPEIKHSEHVGFASSSEGDEMEEVIGVKSKEFRAATRTEEEEGKKGALRTAYSPSDLQSDEDTLPQDREPGWGSENRFLQKGSLSINLTEEKEKRNAPIVVKSDEEEDSSSEGMDASVGSFSSVL